MFKKSICITGHKGILASHFIKKYKKKFRFYFYPKRIENINHFKKWISDKKFNYFIHNAAVFRGNNIIKINKKSSINLIKFFTKFNKIDHFIFISSAHVYGFSKKNFMKIQKENLSLYMVYQKKKWKII